MTDDQRKAIRLLLEVRGEDESYVDVARRLIHAGRPKLEVGGHDFESVGSINTDTGFEPVQCNSCLVISKLQRDVTHSVPWHETLQACVDPGEGKKLVRIIIELDGRRGYATAAVIPLWGQVIPFCDFDFISEWCGSTAEHIVDLNLVRLALADMLEKGRRK